MRTPPKKGTIPPKRVYGTFPKNSFYKKFKPISNFDKLKVFDTKSHKIFTIALAQSENFGVEVAAAP